MLYHVPETVDVSPNGQKQVALLVQPHVAFERVYRARLNTWQAVDAMPATIALRFSNDEKSGLGIPLPAGTTTLYQTRDGARLLIGTGAIGDTAKGEKGRLTAGISYQLLVGQTLDGRTRHVTLTKRQPLRGPRRSRAWFRGAGCDRAS